ncbi:MAG: sulfur reduction protein DsrJ [Ectothiorhodospiraceae bacterium]|nr:sulfur reduction protein DsrJ [Ectothiorhodospiraceae bacterium]
MKDKRMTRQQHWPVASAIAVVFALFSWVAVAGVPLPDIPLAVKGDQCVEDTDFMRRNHMDVMLHQRDETVHEGIRTKRHSLKGCFTCHIVKGADNQPVTIKDPKHFCRVCHDYAAVNVDCFQCHTSIPDAKKSGGKL